MYCSHGDVDVQMLLPFIFEQLLRLHLPINACTSISVYLYEYLSLNQSYQNTACHTQQDLKIQ